MCVTIRATVFHDTKKPLLALDDAQSTFVSNVTLVVFFRAFCTVIRAQLNAAVEARHKR